MESILKDNNINVELVRYIENEIFPLYERNEEGHGIKHIKTVIKRSLELAKKYGEETSKNFVNGILASIVKELGD